MFAIIQSYKAVVLVLFGLYLLSGAVMDLRQKSVPLSWLIGGVCLTAALILSPARNTSELNLTLRLAGGAVGMVFLAIASLAPQSFGKADAFLILMMGALTGLWQTTLSLMIAFFLAALFGLALTRIKGGAKVMAFIPFLAVGFLGGGLIGL